MFDELKNESFDERESRVLSFWEETETYLKSLEDRCGKEKFVFYDGPPFATGLPHYGHLLAGTIKDVVCRYKSMKGYYVPRRLGWDCHGLPVEQEIEKEHGLSGAKSIEEFGIANFNEACRGIVLRYTTEWKKTISRMGRWVDFSDPYHTMDKDFMESVWWVCKQLFDKGLIYEGFKVMPFSAKLGTPLSNFEASENYKDVDDPSIYISFPIEGEDASFIAWTTTPWTLISNQALMVGPEIDYVRLRTAGKEFIMAEARVADLFEEVEILERMKGAALKGMRYKPLFDYFADRKECFQVILEPEVSIEEGTGIVHSAPAFGELDFHACKALGIEPVIPVDSNGRFTAPVTEYLGLFVKDADKEIIKRLKEKGHVVKQGTIRHRYPFCWRSDTPLIYRAMRTWFVAVEQIKEQILAANDQIHWSPEFIKHGRFGKWLEGARDWAISRNRYWGTPIPLWRAEDGSVLCIGSIAELEELSGVKAHDLHRHFIDDIVIEKEGKTYRRIPEVFDCWFESGSMPYAQNHYPFEEKAEFEKTFPADFIAEGLDQTRGWFYTLTVLAAALFDKPAFKNVIVNGIILAEDGSKMSKRLKNYPEPELVIHKYGADAIRLYMLDSPAAKASDLCFTERGVELVLRQIMIPLWNAYSFFITYARINGFTPQKGSFVPKETMDRWMLSRLHHLIRQVEEGLDDYDLPRAVKPFVGFIDQLTNWYIRRCRRRFWEEEATADREEAFNTLYHVLLELSKIAAPFVPFISEAIYQNLRTEAMAPSVHRADYPSYESALRDDHLEEVMDAIQQAVSLGHALRKEHKLKVRQPLPRVFIASGDAKLLGFLEEQKQLLLDELNVKELELVLKEEELVKLVPKPNFRTLGQRVGKRMPKVQEKIRGLTQQELAQLQQGELLLQVEGEEIVLTAEDVLVDRQVRPGLVAQNAGLLTLALDTELNEELLIEGLAREVVNKVNSMRRDMKFEVTDRIRMTFDTTERVRKAFEVHGPYIRAEVLALEVQFAPCEGADWDLNGETARIQLERI